MTYLIQLRPQSVEPYVWRAEYKRNLEMYQEALLDIDTAFINKPEFFLFNGMVKSTTKQEYSKLLKVNEKYNLELEYLRFEKGASLVHLERYNEAIIELNYVISMKLNEKDSRFYRGLTLMNLGYIEEGCNDLLISSNKDHPYAKEFYMEHCK